MKLNGKIKIRSGSFRWVLYSYMWYLIWSRRLMHSVTRRLKFSVSRSHIPLGIFAIKSSTDHWRSITFCGLLCCMLSLQYPHRKKSSGLRYGERGDHRKLLCLEITFPPNNSSRCLIVAVAVRGVAPFCSNHWLANRRSNDVTITRQWCRLHFDIVPD